MLMRGAVSVFVVLLAAQVQGAMVARQSDCEQFGTYPEYKGSCTVTSEQFGFCCGCVERDRVGVLG